MAKPDRYAKNGAYASIGGALTLVFWPLEDTHMPSALQVANYLLTLSDDEAGDNLSNLKLQKLLYYTQGFFLALERRPLFPESIEAWAHGPVVQSVYHEFKEHGSQAIPVPETIDLTGFTEETLDTIMNVYGVYGQFSAWKLRDMTHSEPPWRDTPRGATITHARLRQYFETQIQSDDGE
jgi:uncharacterized phage-associated protein